MIEQGAKKIEVDDKEMIEVIADFIEQGLVENIVAMFKADKSYYRLTGEILADERFAVRLGVSVLFEYLVAEKPEEVELAVPSLIALLNPKTPAYIRGEAVGVLGLIGSEQALAALKPLVKDDDPQVAEIAKDYTNEQDQPQST